MSQFLGGDLLRKPLSIADAGCGWESLDIFRLPFLLSFKNRNKKEEEDGKIMSNRFLHRCAFLLFSIVNRKRKEKSLPVEKRPDRRLDTYEPILIRELPMLRLVIGSVSQFLSVSS